MRWLLATSVLSVLAAAPAHAAVAPIVVAPEKIEVGAEREPITLTLRNSASSPITVELSTAVDGGSASVEPAEVDVPAGEIQRTPITITPSNDDATNGVLLVQQQSAAGTTGPVPEVIPLSVAPDAGSKSLLIVLVALVLAFLVVVGSWLRNVNDALKTFTKPMGPVAWDFSKSWASTLTVVGALLGTVIAGGLLPEQTAFLTSEGYGGLNLLFGIAVLIAPLLYAAAARMTADPGKAPKATGWVWAFLLSSMITVWAVLGELATVGLLFAEIDHAASLSSAAIWLLWGLVALTALLVVAFAWRSIPITIESQSAEAPPEGPAPSDEEREERQAVPDRALPQWSPL